MSQLRYVSVFAGLGGFDRGFDRAGLSPVMQVEVNKHRRAVLAHNWPTVPRRDDVQLVHGSDLPDHEVLAGGFPCQGTSGGAPHRLGLADPRSRLFWEFARLVDEAQPRWFVIENPPSFKRGAVGERDFTAAIQHLAQLRYGLAYRVVDAADLGSAQRRLRILIVGHRGDDCGPATRVLADPEDGGIDLGLDHSRRRPAGRLAVARGPEQPRWYRKSRNPRSSTTDYATYLTGPAQEYANTLTGNDSGFSVRQKHLVMHGDQLRVLTLTEWERLQGFPDGWTASMPQTARFDALGDAMNVHMASWLGHRLAAVHNSLT